MLPGRMGIPRHIGIFDGGMFTYPRAFFAAGAGLRVADVHVRAPGPVHFYKDSFRADCHALPAALAIVRVETNEFRFTHKKKME